MNLLFRNHAKALLGNSAHLHVDPSCIVSYADVPFYMQRQRIRAILGKTLGNIFLNTLTPHHSLFSPNGEWDLNTRPVQTLKAYGNLLDLWEHKNHFQQSQWYIGALEALNKKGFYKHKHTTVTSAAQLDLLFKNSLLGLLESMEEKGYNASLNPEHPRIMIGRNGELIKTRKGRHRFSAAQIVGAKNIVVEIDNIHPLWLKKIEGDFKGNVLKKIKEGLKCIELKHTSPGKDAQ